MLGNDNLSEEEKTKNRIGWDLILDLDGVDFLYSQIVGEIIINYLKQLGINNISTKFSGNKGFHIAIPFEAFSKNIIGIGETRKLFPEIPKKIATFMMFELKNKISTQILKTEGSIKNISKKHNIPIEDLTIDDETSNNFNYMKVIEIDTILISSRHLFRAPYSLNEKSGLVSIPVQNEKIMQFTKEEAKPENVNPEKYKNFEFLNYNPEHKTDADILLIKAHEDENDKEIEETQKRYEQTRKGTERGIIFTGDKDVELFEIDEEIEEKDFPQTIKYILNNNFNDGRKRAIFVLLTFLYSVKWNDNHIKTTMIEWNNKQENKLKANYINAQISWFKLKQKSISPPNFSNDNYYKSIGIPKEIITKDKKQFQNITIKNPLHFVYIFLKEKKRQEENKKNQKNTSKKKKKSQNKK